MNCNECEHDFSPLAEKIDGEIVIRDREHIALGDGKLVLVEKSDGYLIEPTTIAFYNSGFMSFAEISIPQVFNFILKVPIPHDFFEIGDGNYYVTAPDEIPYDGTIKWAKVYKL